MPTFIDRDRDVLSQSGACACRSLLSWRAIHAQHYGQSFATVQIKSRNTSIAALGVCTSFQ